MFAPNDSEFSKDRIENAVEILKNLISKRIFTD